eukprot:g34942.t1
MGSRTEGVPKDIAEYSYNNFGRDVYEDDSVRRCGVIDIASSLWRAVRCENQLDWICKIRKGKQASGHLQRPLVQLAQVLSQGNLEPL